MTAITLPTTTSRSLAVAKWASLLVPLLLGIALFLPTLSYYWVSEDFDYLSHKSLPPGWAAFGVQPLTVFFYRPLILLLFDFDNAVWGNNPVGWRLTNIALNAITIGLVWLFVYRLRRSWLLAGLTAALFAVHPTHPGAVTWVVSIADVPAMLFTFLCLICFVAYRQTGRRWQYDLALLWMLAAILTKEVAVIIPALLLLVDWLFFPNLHPASPTRAAERSVAPTDGGDEQGRINHAPTRSNAILAQLKPQTSNLIPLLWQHGPFILAAGSYLLIRYWMSRAYGVGFGYGFGSRYAIFENVADQLGMLIGLPSVANLKGAGAAAFLVGFVAISLLLAWWGGRLAWFGLALIFVTIIPIANITAYDHASRQIYGPSIGFALLLAAALVRLLTPHPTSATGGGGQSIALKPQTSNLKPTVVALITAVIIGYGCYATAVHNEEWRVAGETNRNFLAQLKTLHPDLQAGSRLFFVNIPIVYRRALEFNEGLQSAVWLTYNDHSLQVYDDFFYRNGQFKYEIAQPSRAPSYYFRYLDDGTLKEYASAAALLASIPLGYNKPRQPQPKRSDHERRAEGRAAATR